MGQKNNTETFVKEKRTRAGIINLQILEQHMGVSKNRGTPKWMVYKGKPY